MKSARLTKIIFVVYLLVLTWGILFKFETELKWIPFFENERNINWIPFASPMVVNGDISLSEMLFNILCFIPFGVALPLVNKNWFGRKVLAAGFLLSLSYEVLQFILTIGSVDVTDLLMNTLGALCGLIIFSLLRKYFPAKIRQIVNLFGLILGGLSLFILGI